MLRHPGLQALLASYNRDVVVWLVRDVLSGYRDQLPNVQEAPSLNEVAERVVRESAIKWRAPRRLINATGVLLHTNLGRAPLSREALEAMSRVAAYSDLEYSLDTGERGSRQQHVAAALRALTGAEAAHITVNNASAVLLALAALCRGKDVLVSRGQAVEIGGGFRIPVILRQSGARLVEVGTTNRTRLADFAGEIGPRTGGILHVHPSNFRLVGFSETVPLAQLAALSHQNGLPLLVDNGSGALVDTAHYGLEHEPTPQEALRAGAGIVTFSGDKLLGGPQAGIILGSTELVHTIATHPLARAMRPDKMTLAGLHATLMAYMHDRVDTLPLWIMIQQSASNIEARARALQMHARAHDLSLELLAGESTLGGGSLPGACLPTTLLLLPRPLTAAALRLADPGIVARTQRGRVLLDLRTVAPEHDDQVLLALTTLNRERAREPGGTR